MSLGYATIITSIIPEREEKLRSYLREKAQPKFNPRFNPNERVDIMQCQDALPLHEVKGLHLCSMVIVDGVEKLDWPCLVFEATFDGSREEFFDNLLRVALPGIDEIYKNCRDYPVSESTVRALVKEYLISHDVGADTFYSGSPGRSVAQIRGERDLHEKIAQHVSRRRLEKDAPATFLELQRELQREVIRKEPSYRWAEQPAVTPWELTNRKLIGILVLGLGALAFLALADGLGTLVAPLLQRIESLIPGSELPLQSVFGLGTFAKVPTPIWLIVAWFALRFVALALEVEDPRKTSFYRRFFTHVLFVLRIALVIFLIWLSLDPTLEWAPVQNWSLFAALVATAALVLLALALGYFAKSAKLAVQFQALRNETLLRCWLELLRFAMVVALVFAYLIVKPHLPGIVIRIVGTLTRVVPISMLGYALIGVLTFYVLAAFLAMLVRGLELADRARYASARGLAAKLDTPSVYEREEGGVNKYQNHLASVTYVKPGLLRIALLRLTLFAIGRLARFWFNQGELGGIPTILAARWVLIDGGRRLLFLTNYGGGWDSYLNEFIDMGAVKGLNAIWTNTFIKLRDSNPGYAFPETSFYFWKGAQAEQPFKAFVRRSQVETLMWYSAYPTLRIENINVNTELRQALFKSLAACELDSVFLRAGL